MKIKKLFISLISLLCLGCDNNTLQPLSMVDLNIELTSKGQSYYSSNRDGYNAKLFKSLTEVKEVFCDNEFFKFECTISEGYFLSNYIIFCVGTNSTKGYYAFQNDELIIQIIYQAYSYDGRGLYGCFFEINKKLIDEYETINYQVLGDPSEGYIELL